jgi:hypothetical protein
MAFVFVFYFGAFGHVTCQHMEGRKAHDTQGDVFDDVLHENPPEWKMVNRQNPTILKS